MARVVIALVADASIHAGEGRVPRSPVQSHGAELVHREDAVVLADATLSIDHARSETRPYGARDGYEERREQDQQQPGDDLINGGLDNALIEGGSDDEM